MNRRITRKVAEESAREISMLLYEERITDLQNVCKAQLSLIVRKYIPSEVIQVIDKYPQYFDLVGRADIKCVRPGFTEKDKEFEKMIGGVINFLIPNNRSAFIVSRQDYQLFRENYLRKKALVNEQSTVFKATRDTILSYKFENGLKKDYPHVWKNLVWTDNDSPLNLTDIDVEGKLKIKNKEKDGK